ncbi:MAG: DNA (cytosine-5-)-methyltransferase [Alphaproteobacteria bacterium]|nr:DNA (cytosine-5-)-methyltransferase [Alphaproteobacteria bacterium]
MDIKTRGEPRPTVGSLFSGIGGFDLGLERAGWSVSWQVEIDPFRKKILGRHWPGVDHRNDITTDTSGLSRVDLVCGGFPCQDLSVAGRRAGLAGARSSLFFEFASVLESIQPRWCLIENVPGLLSTQHGRDFAVVLGTLGDLGYWWTYRVLDSQFFGVPQRRNRVYIVGHLGAPCPPEILFEPEGSSWDPETGEEAKPEVAATLGGGTGKRGWNSSIESVGAFIPVASGPLEGSQLSRRSSSPDGNGVFIPRVAFAAQRKDRVTGDTDTYIARPVRPKEGQHWDDTAETYIVNGRQDPIVGLQPLDSRGHSLAVAVRTAHVGSNGWGVSEDGRSHSVDRENKQAVVSKSPELKGRSHDLAFALRAGRRTADSDGAAANVVAQPVSGTVTGAERHNGNSTPIPGNYVVCPSSDADRMREVAGIPGRVDAATSDGLRYAALGDAVTVNVAEWIGRRILKAHVGQ